ncbi:MAG: ribulose-phosphate 3-epimerase [bacterium]
MGRVAIYPSILSADFSRLAEEIAVVEKAGADGIHLDIMDGHFVPNISFGPPVVRSLRRVTVLPLWVHLMIEKPSKYLEAFKECGVQGITVHAEVPEDLESLSSTIHRLGLEAGISINPGTRLDAIDEVSDCFERVLVMTVEPGFGGQAFMPDPLEKIRVLKQNIRSRRKPLLIEVDGGVDRTTAPRIVEAGTDVLIVGSAIFGADDPASELKAIREAAEGMSIHSL